MTNKNVAMKMGRVAFTIIILLMLKTAYRLEKISAIWNGFGRAWFSGANLSEARMRALWASQFIKIIRGDSDPDNTSILKTPLYQQLETCSLDSNLIQVDDLRTLQIQKQMKAMFTTGIEFWPKIQKQCRIEHASLKDDKNQLGQFVFIPTVLVTRPIFKHIKNNLANRTLIHDFYGIGKTASLICYAVISEHINKYLHSTIESQDQSEIQLLSQLMRNNIIQRTPKVFYTSTGYSHHNRKDLIRALIQEISSYGITKFSKDQKQKIYCYDKIEQTQRAKLSQIFKTIEYYFSSSARYNKLGIQHDSRADTLMIIDQINFLENELQIYNRQKKQGWYALRQLKDCQRSWAQTRNTYSLILNSLSGRILFNAATNVNEKAMGKSTQTYEAMELDPQSKIVRQRLGYGRSLYTNWGQKCFKDYMWKEIELQLTQPGKISAKVKRISLKKQAISQGAQQQQQKQRQLSLEECRELYYEHMEQVKITCNTNIYFIKLKRNQSSRNIQIFENVSENPTKDKFIMALKILIMQINWTGKYQIKGNLFNTLQKYQIRNCLLVEICHNLKKKMIEKDIDLQKIDQNLESKMGYQILQSEEPELYEQFRDTYERGFIDQRMLQFQFIEEAKAKKIVFYYTMSELYFLLEKFAQEKKSHFSIPEFIQQMQKRQELKKIIIQDSYVSSIYQRQAKFRLNVELLKDVTNPLYQYQQNMKKSHIAGYQFSTQPIKISKLAKISPFLPKLKHSKFSAELFSSENMKKLKQSIEANTSYNQLPLFFELWKAPYQNFALILEKTNQNRFTIDNKGYNSSTQRQEDREVFSFAILNYSKSKDKSQKGVFLIKTYRFINSTKLTKVKAQIQESYYSLLQYRERLLEILAKISKGTQIIEIGNETKPLISFKGKSQEIKIIETEDAILQMSQYDFDTLNLISQKKDSIKIIHYVICQQEIIEDLKCKDNEFRKFVEQTEGEKVQLQVAVRENAKILSNTINGDSNLFSKMKEDIS